MAEAAEFTETTSARARRWLRHTAAVLAGAGLLAGTIQLAAPQPAHAAHHATGSRTAHLAIDSLTPTTPSSGDTVTVKGVATNDGDATIGDASVGLRLGPLLHSRSQIENVTHRTSFSSSLDGTEVGGAADHIGTLRAGASHAFTLSVPVRKLHLGASGVYQLGVSLTGTTSHQPWQHVLGIQRTFLPWQPGSPSRKTQMAVAWPLISTTHITARTGSDEQQTPVFSDDDLAKEFAPGGRLQQMVSLGKNLPVTWVIDPDLLATADAMTRDYKVETGGHDSHGNPKVRDGKGQAVARHWLDELSKAVAGHQVVALPFADPDLASIAHDGKDVPGAVRHIRTATKLASDTVVSVLGVKPRTDVAWPVDGAVDRSIVDVATSAGARTVIARSDSMREASGETYTPTAARRIGRHTTALVADARLSTTFSGDMSKAENSTLAVQEFLAQSQMITLQAPEKQRSVLVAPQRMPTTSQARAMAKALQGLKGESWSQPQDLAQAAKATPDPHASRQVPGTADYSSALRRQELPTSAFRGIRQTGSMLTEFEKILSSRDRVAPPFDTAMLRETSTSWRSRPGGAAFRAGVQSYLDGLTKKVRFVPKTDMTLSGRTATIPVTVQNNLVQGVKGLRLVLRSSQSNRLAVTDPQEIQIEGGHSQSVKFGTTANANGRAWITAQLYTEDGQPYGKPMRFQINVTEITSTVLLVIAGGVLLLVLAGVRIYLQRKRNAARGGQPGGGNGEAEGPDDGGPTPDSSDGVHIALPQQPGDPAPDTGSQSADPSGSGEKVDH